MKTGFLLLLANSLLAATLAYIDVDDSLDFESMTKNSDILKKMMDCFFDRKPCDDVLAHYKSHIQESLQDSCAECTPLQKHHYKLFIEGMKRFYPEDYTQYTQFDPNAKPSELKDLEEELSKY